MLSDARNPDAKAMSEEQILQNYRRGEPQASAELAERYRALIWNLAYRLSSRCVSAEELVQSGYVGLFEAAKRYKAECGTNLITYAVPWVLGEMKRSRRAAYDAFKRERVLSDGPYEEMTLADQIPEHIGIRIEWIDLKAAIESLNEAEQKVICLRYLRDKTQAEVALLLDKSQAQISRIENRAMDAIRSRLSGTP